MTVTLHVDNRAIESREGMTLLKACLDNDIYIPNLCYLEGMDHPPASCRLCFVAVGNEEKPVPSSTVKVSEGMFVRTDTPGIRRLQRSALRLLLSVHHVDCAHCPANKKCALQDMAKFLKVGLKPKHLENFLKEPEILDDHPFLNYYPNRCVLCGRCITVCKNRHGRPYLTFAKRGFDTRVSSYGEENTFNLPCEDTVSCVDICPVSAITLKN